MLRNNWAIGMAAVLMAAGAVQAQSWKFVAVADNRGGTNGVNTQAVSELASRVIAEGAELVVVAGDLVSGGVDQAGLQSQLTTWRNTMEPVYAAGIKVYPVAGNHETGTSGWQTAWNNVFTGAKYGVPTNGPTGETGITYSVTNKNAFFVGMDQVVPGSMRVNQTWVDQQFAANTQPHVFAFGHYPAFKANHADCLDDNAAARTTLWNSLKAEGARAYFTGHDHMYNHARIDDGDGNPNNDLHQFIVGNGGAPYYTSYSYDAAASAPFTPVAVSTDYNSWGYMLVEINDSLVTMTYKHRMGDGTYAAQGDVFTYAVPEPTSLTLLGLVVGGLIRRRRA